MTEPTKNDNEHAVCQDENTISGISMGRIASKAARLRATECDFEIVGHGTKIYFIDKNWESSIIGGDEEVTEVGNLKEFREAFKATDVKTIFIPYLNAEGVKTKDILPMEQLRRICGEYANSKVIYMEESGE